MTDETGELCRLQCEVISGDSLDTKTVKEVEDKLCAEKMRVEELCRKIAKNLSAKCRLHGHHNGFSIDIDSDGT